MRVIGLDVSRSFAEVAYLENGLVQAGGRVTLLHPELEHFARRLGPDDHVVLEATGNTAAIVAALKSHAGRVVVANPLKVRLIAEARIKTDKIDAAILAQLYASGFLPEVWTPDDATLALRRQVARRTQIVRQRTRLKNEIHAVLAANRIAPCPASDLFGKKGRSWLADQPLPLDERIGVEQRLRALDLLAHDAKQIEEMLARSALSQPQVARLMTITGINVMIALSLVAAIGDISRFSSPEKLVSYLGLNPSVYQSGLQPAKHGRISKRGRSHARGMLVEGAWAVAQTPGPLRAFFLRIKDRRGEQIAAVACARKLAVIAWYVLTRDENFVWERPALVAHKRRQLELQAGMPEKHGSHKGLGADYNLKAIRDQERAVAEQAEKVYQKLFSRWRQAKPKEAQPCPWPPKRNQDKVRGAR
ncbi:IS110 family transposase [Telluria mixta]|uniref:IS110 family transposase n=1 Tax=Telluria mixta TaxID=34071 RepID=A0ABT2BS29_9BURK|nr:IS110 family transposase [Telluria mixta]MCS0627928.1 IS110 family transposase [Telluria mixta]WEM93953.1 IS110 family transposase [Telluria mixta]